MTQSVEQQGEGDIEMHNGKKKAGMNAYETVNTKEEDTVVAMPATTAAATAGGNEDDKTTNEGIASLYEVRARIALFPLL